MSWFLLPSPTFNSCHSQHIIHVLAILSDLKNLANAMPFHALKTVSAISAECTSFPFEQWTFIQF